MRKDRYNIYSSACINLSRKIFQKKIATYVFLEARILTISWPSRVIFAFLSYYFFCKIYFDEHWIRFVTITISWGRRAIILNKETIWIRCLLCSTPLNLNSKKRGGGTKKIQPRPLIINFYAFGFMWTRKSFIFNFLFYFSFANIETLILQSESNYWWMSTFQPRYLVYNPTSMKFWLSVLYPVLNNVIVGQTFLQLPREYWASWPLVVFFFYFGVNMTLNIARLWEGRKKYPAHFISKDLKEEEGGKINPTHVLQSLDQP